MRPRESTLGAANEWCSLSAGEFAKIRAPSRMGFSVRSSLAIPFADGPLSRKLGVNALFANPSLFPRQDAQLPKQVSSSFVADNLHRALSTREQEIIVVVFLAHLEIGTATPMIEGISQRLQFFYVAWCIL